MVLPAARMFDRDWQGVNNMSLRICYLVALSGAFLSSIAFADDAAERAKLIGTWQSQGGGGANSVWVLDSQGDVFHVTNSLGEKKIAEYACNLGKECEVKDGETESQGDAVFQRSQPGDARNQGL